MNLLKNLTAGDLTGIYGTDPDWYGYIGIGIVIKVKENRHTWTESSEALVLVNSKCSWFDTKHFMFCDPAK